MIKASRGVRAPSTGLPYLIVDRQAVLEYDLAFVYKCTCLRLIDSKIINFLHLWYVVEALYYQLEILFFVLNLASCLYVCDVTDEVHIDNS